MNDLLGTARAVAWKDLLAELRGRDVVTTGLLFALLVLVIFNFAFDLRVEQMGTVGPGALWVAFLFAGVLCLGRSFTREMDRGTLDGLRASPADRGGIYFGKLLSNLVFIGAVEVISLPVFAALYNLRPYWPHLLLIAFLGTVGIAAIGTLFAAISAHTRAREVMLPLLLFPLILPVVIASVSATGAALGTQPPELSPWLQLLVAYDAIFLAVSFLVFGEVLEA